MVTMVKTIARAHRDLCVLAVLLCCIMQSIFDANNHPTVGATRGLTLMVRFFGGPQNLLKADCLLIRSNTVVTL